MFKASIIGVIFLVSAVVQGFGASGVSCSPTSVGFGDNVTCTLTYPAANYPSGTSVGFFANGQKWGDIPAQHGGGTFTTGVPVNIRNAPGTYTIEEQEYPPGTTINLASTTLTVRGVGGFVNPKYVIVGVTYAPPGPSSSVTYANSTLVGNTTKIVNSFKSGVKFSISITGKISAWHIVGGVAAKITGTDSTEYTQTSSNTSTVTISKQATVSDKTNGTGNAFSPVNHDYDTIWLWLNPLVLLTVDPQDTSKVQWNGYGFDPNDVNGMDVFGVQVGWLNGHFGNNPSINAVLARSWVTSTEPSMTWPAGEGPGLTQTDISKILLVDPFTSGTYSLPSPLPSTTSDGRFTQIPFPPNPVNYAQAGPGNGGGTTTMYDTVNVNSSALTTGLAHSFTEAVGIQGEFSGGVLGESLTVDLGTTWTFEWDHSWENTLTTTKTLTKALSVTGPGCPQTSPPCVPTYTGPGEFIVYQDNLYGTFMFYQGN
jgi:hypothetical protein